MLDEGYVEASRAWTWVPMPLCWGRVLMSPWLRASQEPLIHLAGKLDPLQPQACPQQPLAGHTGVFVYLCTCPAHSTLQITPPSLPARGLWVCNPEGGS